MKHTPGPCAAPEEIEPFQVCILDNHYPLGPCRTENSSKEIQLNLHLVLCAEMTERKIHHGKQGGLHLINPQQPALKGLIAFCISKFCNLVQYLRKSLEFPINLLGSFCSTGLQGVTHLFSKLSDSKPHERLETLNCNTVEGEQRVQSEECVYITVSAFAIMLAGRVNIVRLLSFSGKEKCSNWYPGIARLNTCIICLCICSESERCFCCQGRFAVLSTKECCHVFHSRQKWKQQVLQNPFFLSLNWAWLLASFLQKELISVQYCKS